MKIRSFCGQCSRENGGTAFEPAFGDYFDERIAHLECAQGHKTINIVSTPKFKILMDSAAIALIDGFTIEACASFYSALERFYEYGLRAMCTVLQVPADLFTQAFKQTEAQSERQLGAFIFLHTIVLGEVYKPNTEIAGFRNKIIHRGYIPSFERAYKFGAEVHSSISSSLQKIKLRCGPELKSMEKDDQLELFTKLPKDIYVGLASSSVIFPLDWKEKMPEFKAQFELMKSIIKMNRK